MPSFEHIRHKPPAALQRPRGLILAVPEMQSQVNLSRIIRAAGCFGVGQVLVEGRAKTDPRIARDALEVVELRAHRSLEPRIKALADEGYRVVGLEQATPSQPLAEYRFANRTLLLIGHERHGLSESWLALCQDVVEIPVYGRPHSFNAATSAAIAVYEYCRQWPHR